MWRRWMKDGTCVAYPVDVQSDEKREDKQQESFHGVVWSRKHGLEQALRRARVCVCHSTHMIYSICFQ